MKKRTIIGLKFDRKKSKELRSFLRRKEGLHESLDVLELGRRRRVAEALVGLELVALAEGLQGGRRQLAPAVRNDWIAVAVSLHDWHLQQKLKKILTLSHFKSISRKTSDRAKSVNE